MDNVRPSQIVIMASAAVVLLFSFMDGTEGGDNAWSDFGLSTFPALLAIAVGGLVAAEAFGTFRIPELLTLRGNQVVLVLSFAAAVIMIGWFLTFQVGEFDPDLEAGFYLMLLGSIGLVVGAVMEEKASPSSGSAATPPAPF